MTLSGRRFFIVGMRAFDSPVGAICLASALMGLGGCGRAAGELRPIVLDPARTYHKPGQSVQFCKDPTHRLVLSDIIGGACAFQRVQGNYPAFGISRGNVWMRWRMEPMRAREGRWLMELAAPILDTVDVFRVHDSGQITHDTLASDTPPALRPVPHINLLFVLGSVIEGETVYVRATSRAAMNIPLFLWNERAFHSADALRTFGFGLFFGVMLVMCLYNLLLYAQIRDRAYLYYVIYILFITGFFATISGHILLVLPDAWSGRLYMIGPPVALAASAAAVLFSRRFLLLEEQLPPIYYALTAVMWLHLVGLATLPLLSSFDMILVGNVVPLMAIILIVSGALVLARRGFKPAVYFLIAWAALITGVLLFILQNLAFIPSGFSSTYGQFLGAGLESILLSLALGYRINTMKTAEKAAQQQLVTEQAIALERERKLSESFERFVPKEFLESLGKESIVNISRGDAVKKEMAVLFMDIRGFTGLSERIGPTETFEFLNRFHGIMEPVIQAHGGFIDKFIGDAIMALFPDPTRSVLAAAAMQEALSNSDIYDIQIGIGIHSGELVLGTVGSPRRLDTTVIGDTVNLASRIESINKEYGTQVIVSDSVFKLARLEPSLSLRELDALRVRGKSRPVVLYELMNVVPEAARRRREDNLDLYLTGLLAYRTGSFAQAQESFRAYMERAIEDPVVSVFLKRLDTLLRSAPPDWDGIW